MPRTARSSTATRSTTILLRGEHPPILVHRERSLPLEPWGSRRVTVSSAEVEASSPDPIWRCRPVRSISVRRS
ncbi:hypothetical protein [Commensalibacter melissae]|uniref:hypothetical protein n=1 Tax=Commensalibacter melissae TaxID=2070537 RepID=UPI0018C253CC|nr:hypothetical protein [Commensalibacter melissae]